MDNFYHSPELSPTDKWCKCSWDIVTEEEDVPLAVGKPKLIKEQRDCSAKARSNHNGMDRQEACVIHFYSNTMVNASKREGLQ
jgi:hypothetical protein